MATVRKRQWQTKAGIKSAWVADYFAPDRDGTMVRRQKSFKRQKDARAWLPKTQHEIDQGTHVPDSASSTLSEAIDRWLKRGEAERLEHSTMRQRRLHKAHILARLDGSTKVSRITVARLEAFRNEMLIDHSRATARKVITSLRGILKQAKALHLASADMTIKAAGRHKAKLKVGFDFPSTDDIKAVIEAAADPKARAMVCLLAFAGLRASEIRGLDWKHLELGSTPKVTISQRADELGVIGSPKSKAARRTVGLNATTADALRTWKVAQPPGRELVFGTRTNRPAWLANMQRRVLDPLLAKAGVRHYGFHAFRHYAVSSWLKTCDGDFKAVQVRAGHATLGLTLDTYGHLLDSNDSDQIAAAERLVLG